MTNIWYNTYMDKTYIFTVPKEVTYGRGYVYSLQYHIVWTTRDCKPVFRGNIRDDVIAYLKDTMDDLQMKPLVLDVAPDYIHILADCKPQLCLSDAVKVLKGNTARWLFMNHPEIKGELGQGHLWNPSYFVSTVSGQSLEQAEKYISDQRKT